MARNGHRAPRVPEFTKDAAAIQLPVEGGRVWIDPKQWPDIRAAVVTHSAGLIVDRDGKPAMALGVDEFGNKDSALLACDVECRLAGATGFYLELYIPGLD